MGPSVEAVLRFECSKIMNWCCSGYARVRSVAVSGIN